MRKLLFNYSFYSHPEIGNFTLWHEGSTIPGNKTNTNAAPYRHTPNAVRVRHFYFSHAPTPLHYLPLIHLLPTHYFLLISNCSSSSLFSRSRPARGVEAGQQRGARRVGVRPPVDTEFDDRARRDGIWRRGLPGQPVRMWWRRLPYPQSFLFFYDASPSFFSCTLFVMFVQCMRVRFLWIICDCKHYCEILCSCDLIFDL
jgi:hypothetical protein